MLIRMKIMYFLCNGNRMILFCLCLLGVLDFSFSQNSQGQCRNEGDPTILSCCLNYIDVGGKCIACPSGTMGINCSKICPDGFYGQFCLKKCYCDHTQRCSKARGCVCKGDNCSKDTEIDSISEINIVPCKSNEEFDSFNELSKVPCKSNEAAIIVLGLIIGLLLIFIIPITVQFYRIKCKGNTARPVHAYMDTDLKAESKPLHFYEDMKMKEPNIMTGSYDEHYLEPVQSSGLQRKNTGHKQIGTGINSTNYSKINEEDIVSELPDEVGSVQANTIKSRPVVSATKEYEHSYLDMTSKPKETYLEVISTKQPKLQFNHNTSDCVDAGPLSQEKLYE
ncbi:uncharacterized protein LOC133189762 [Saccostrea echinata]|uniref:uncharacterized protein LOC133189762 n=1 Tax=Saccostrea echinata TaxID=191078 RepID=UPI002A82C1EF|nr:uncharacterized protein LOC133189762 [Saccostrea echinata]